MIYKITHTTKYNYTDPISVCHNLVHLAPRDTVQQKCEYHRLAVQPQPSDRDRRSDYFGNQVEYFSIQEPHRRLMITATSRVRVDLPLVVDVEASPAWEAVAGQLRTDRSWNYLDANQFCYQSGRIPVDRTLWNAAAPVPVAAVAAPPVAEAAPPATPRLEQQFQEYVRESFSPGRKILAAARELTARINADFTFDAKATTLHTPVGEVFRNRHGVCQDFAHLQIALLRSLGLAARYVSGYLRTNPPPGKPRLVGADVSHAWISVFAGEAGWIDFDPTNDVMPAADHIAVAWGRDYNDVCPIQGVFVGGGRHSMSVSVDVAPLS